MSRHLRFARNWALVALVFTLAGANQVRADVIDLTTAGATVSFGGAIFQQFDPQATGTGLINSFVEIGGNTDTIQAYNTTVNNTFDNGSSDQFNHELTLGEVPIVTIGGVAYREFILDINQTGEDPLLSLDDIQIFLSSTANQSTETIGAGGLVGLTGSLVYRLDGSDGDGDADWVKLLYSLNTGSGSGDMFLYVPNSLFSGGTDSSFVYLYSIFGLNENNNDGFEEWAVRVPTGTPPPPGVPEPSSLVLLGSGLIGLAGFARRGWFKK